jgi:fengycin family lipopeptide synthetase D
VKIRGFRIEPEEIQNRLQDHKKIKTAVVVTGKKENNKLLCAYYVPADKNVSTAELKEYLARSLPHYMIPVYFVPLEVIPMTPNGKVDQRALPEPGLESGEDYVMPDTEMEKKVAAVWKEVLHLDQIGVNDGFFDIGGNSANILRVHMKLKELVKMDIPLMALFQNPTIYSLANYLSVDAIGGDSTQIPDNQQFDAEKTMMKKSLQKLGTNQYRQSPGEELGEK